MATQISKPLKRLSDAYVRDAGARRLVVTLYPHGLLGLRPERTRREETVSLSACWDMAVRQRVAREKAERRARKRGK